MLETWTRDAFNFNSSPLLFKTFPLILHEIHTPVDFEHKFVRLNDFIEYLRNGIDSSVVKRRTDCWVESRVSRISFENETLDKCENKKKNAAAGNFYRFYCRWYIFSVLCRVEMNQNQLNESGEKLVLSVFISQLCETIMLCWQRGGGTTETSKMITMKFISCN